MKKTKTLSNADRSRLLVQIFEAKKIGYEPVGKPARDIVGDKVKWVQKMQKKS